MCEAPPKNTYLTLIDNAALLIAECHIHKCKQMVVVTKNGLNNHRREGSCHMQ